MDMISFRCNRPNGYMIYISNQIHTEKARGRWPQPSQTRSWRQVAGGVQECMALPLSLITTNAQLRPAAPCTPPPGCAPAHHASIPHKQAAVSRKPITNQKSFSQNHNKPKRLSFLKSFCKEKGAEGRMLWEGGACCGRGAPPAPHRYRPFRGERCML